MIRRRALARSFSTALAVITMAGCATTVVDDDETTGSAIDVTDSAIEVEVESTVPAAEVPTVGTAADLLPEIAADLGRLSEAIVGDVDTDPNDTVERIEAAWDAIRDEIETTRPELLSGMQTAVDMARTAVDTKRPADADKAFVILDDLIDAFDSAS